MEADDSSKLSPWLAAGCLSPRRVYREVQRYEAQRTANNSTHMLVFHLLVRDWFRCAFEPMRTRHHAQTLIWTFALLFNLIPRSDSVF